MVEGHRLAVHRQQHLTGFSTASAGARSVRVRISDDEDMARLIPPVLRDTDLPLAVLSAARLDGVLWSIHDGYCPIDEPDRAELRALALSHLVQAHDIIVGRTAAWVHGAGTSIVGPVELRTRTRPLGAWRTGVRYREIAIADTEVLRLSPQTPVVTTRSRTVSDIAVDSQRTVSDVDLILTLCDGNPSIVRAYANDLVATCRRPGKTAGLELLAQVIATAEQRR